MSIVNRLRHSGAWQFVGLLVSASAIALLSAFAMREVHAELGVAVAFERLLLVQLGVWITTLVMFLPLMRLRRRWILGSAARGWRRGALEALFAVLYVALTAPVSLALAAGLVEDLAPGLAPSFPVMTRMILLRMLLTYALGALVTEALRSSFALQDREREAQVLALRQQRLQSQLTEARLESLKAQLQPHFLFNALNAVNGLILEGSSSVASRAVTSLADLLRGSLHHAVGDTVSVGRELKLIDHYIALEELRLGERLRVRREIDAGVLSERVPPLVLLPLVENAIRHGIGPRVEGGTLWLRARTRGGELLLSIQDDGQGFDLAQVEREADSREEGGIGMRNCRARLETLYGDRARFHVASRPGEGTTVTLSLPRTSAQPGVEEELPCAS